MAVRAVGEKRDGTGARCRVEQPHDEIGTLGILAPRAGGEKRFCITPASCRAAVLEPERNRVDVGRRKCRVEGDRPIERIETGTQGDSRERARMEARVAQHVPEFWIVRIPANRLVQRRDETATIGPPLTAELRRSHIDDGGERLGLYDQAFAGGKTV